MSLSLKIGTRESQLAMWQAKLVQGLLAKINIQSELVLIKSEGDIDLVTPLYELGVQGIFTKTLDAALLSKRIDIAVHSMKDVPTKLADGIQTAAILKRASHKDILVYKGDPSFLDDHNSEAIIATSSVRRKAQWLHRYPKHVIENLRGNVNTRLKKVNDNKWNGAIFAAAGLERIDLRPENAVNLDWMLPAPAQGAILVAGRQGENEILEACNQMNHRPTALCTTIERDFLRALMGGCSTPISALAESHGDKIIFKGSVCSTDGKENILIEKEFSEEEAINAGSDAAKEILKNKKAADIIYNIQKNG